MEKSNRNLSIVMANNKVIPVSVIVTVLNEIKSIELLVSSLINQTVSPKEIVITDGGSNDGTWELLKQYQKNTLPFELVVLQRSGNRSVGRNQAIKESTTKIIAITDAGCIPHSDWLQKIWEKYQAENKPVIAGYYDAQPKTAFEEAVVPYVLVMPDRVNPSAFLPATRSMMIEKKVWEDVGKFDEYLSDNEDYDFARRLAAQKIPIGFASEAKVTWIPRASLSGFIWMIYRFARGDMRAGIVRPKVLLIIIRVLIWCLITVSLVISSPLVGFLFFVSSGVFYSLWSIKKNMKYTPRGWYWLPVLQITSDVMIVFGSIEGWANRIKSKSKQLR